MESKGYENLPATVSDARKMLSNIATVEEGVTMDRQAQRLRDAMILAEDTEKANEWAEIACEAGAAVGEMLGTEVSPGRPKNGAENCPRVDNLANAAANRYRKMARIPAAERAAYYKSCTNEAEIISKAGLLKYGGGDPFASKWTRNPEWYTPSQYIEAARKLMGSIDLDPATAIYANEVVKAEAIFTEQDDGLKQTWWGNVWLNPPYKAPTPWVRKLVEEYEAGNVQQGILLTNNNTDTSWWHLIASRGAVICFTAGRISFYNEDGQASSPTNGQTFCYLGNRKKGFYKAFAEFGHVMMSMSDA